LESSVGLWIALAPRARGRDDVPGHPKHWYVFGSLADLDRGPPAVELGATGAAVELAQRRQLALGGRHRLRGGDERGIGHQPTRCRVDLARVAVALLPQFSCDGQVACAG